MKIENVTFLMNDDLDRLALILRDALRCGGVIGQSDRDDVEWFCDKVLGEVES
jgi:hypothetical protein